MSSVIIFRIELDVTNYMSNVIIFRIEQDVTNYMSSVIIFRIEQDVTNYMSSVIIFTLLVRHIIKIFFNTFQWRIGSLSVIFERNIYECYLKRNTAE